MADRAGVLPRQKELVCSWVGLAACSWSSPAAKGLVDRDHLRLGDPYRFSGCNPRRDDVVVSPARELRLDRVWVETVKVYAGLRRSVLLIESTVLR